MQKAYNDGGQTCIDCHKGIAHKLPDMTAGFKAIHDELASDSKSLTPVVGVDPLHAVDQAFLARSPEKRGRREQRKAPAPDAARGSRARRRLGEGEVRRLAAGRRGANVLRRAGQAHLRRRAGSRRHRQGGAWPDDEGLRHRSAVDRSQPRGLDDERRPRRGQLETLRLRSRDVQRELRSSATR